MFPAKHTSLIDPSNIVIGGDTDIVIIFLCNAENLENNHLRYNFGVDYNNSHKYIDIIMLAKNMKIIKALPGVYALTGNNSTSIFSKRKNSTHSAHVGKLKI